MPVPEVFHPVISTVEVVTYASRAGEERRNVFHYLYALLGGGRPSAAELMNLANDVEGSIINEQEDFTCVGTVWYQVSVRDIHDEFGASVSKPINRAGVGGTNVLPGNVSHCLTKRSGAPGRSRRGRFYLFDLDEIYFNGDDMNPAFIPAVNDLCTALLLPRQTGRFVPCIASKTLGNSAQVLSMTYDLTVDSQRRRSKGRGI